MNYQLIFTVTIVFSYFGKLEVKNIFRFHQLVKLYRHIYSVSVATTWVTSVFYAENASVNFAISTYIILKRHISSSPCFIVQRI